MSFALPKLLMNELVVWGKYRELQAPREIKLLLPELIGLH